MLIVKFICGSDQLRVPFQCFHLYVSVSDAGDRERVEELLTNESVSITIVPARNSLVAVKFRYLKRSILRLS